MPRVTRRVFALSRICKVIRSSAVLFSYTVTITLPLEDKTSPMPTGVRAIRLNA